MVWCRKTKESSLSMSSASFRISAPASTHLMSMDIFQQITHKKQPNQKFLPRSNREKQKRIVIILSYSMLWLCNGYVEIFLFSEKLLTWLTQGIFIPVKTEVYECLQIAVCSFYFIQTKAVEVLSVLNQLKGCSS